MPGVGVEPTRPQGTIGFKPIAVASYATRAGAPNSKRSTGVRHHRKNDVVHSGEDLETVRSLLAAGCSTYEVARRTGIPRSTVHRWKASPPIRVRDPLPDLPSLPSASYAHLLGLYLGDGHVVRHRSSFTLSIFCDSRYTGIVAGAAEAIRDVTAGTREVWTRLKGDGGCTVVTSAWIHWPALFPQHGSGRKHHREIDLEDWQLRHTHTEPEALIRGLIESDGCRCIARQRVGERIHTYERYSVSNRSADVRRIFCDHLDLLGIAWTRATREQIAIDRRSEVAKLDAFVGPKM